MRAYFQKFIPAWECRRMIMEVHGHDGHVVRVYRNGVCVGYKVEW